MFSLPDLVNLKDPKRGGFVRLREKAEGRVSYLEKLIILGNVGSVMQ